jgi:acyl carrier protein
MVPAVFMQLEELPLTANGKVDRKRLPTPEAARSSQGYTGPQTVTEEILCGIWEEVLKREQIGIEENFFDLGGHSLLATRVITRIRNAFAVELPLRALFEGPTVADLARGIEQQKRERSQFSPPPMGHASREAPLPLSFAQQRLWFLDQLQPNSTAYTLFYALRLRGD